MNTRVYILFFTFVFLASPLLLLTFIHVQFNLSISLFDAFLYSTLTLVLFGMVITLDTPAIIKTFSDGDLVRSLLKVATIAIGLSIFIISLSQEIWGFPLYIAVLHWLSLLVFSQIALSLTRFQTNAELKNRGFQFSSDHENILVVGATGLAENYIRWIEDTAAEYITLAGVLEENMPGNKRAFLSSNIIGQPVELTDILKKFRVGGTQIKRLVIAKRFQDLSSEAQGVLTYYESKGALLIDRMGDRVAWDDDSGLHPLKISGSPIVNKSVSTNMDAQRKKLRSELACVSNHLFVSNRDLLASGLM